MYKPQFIFELQRVFFIVRNFQNLRLYMIMSVNNYFENTSLLIVKIFVMYGDIQTHNIYFPSIIICRYAADLHA